ncbi:MAG: FtsQ-type POTRA domain-containing protein [Thermoleophilaceae bacterium]|nr:FtsQ-type POTRA domain-containing protein [Thermoleophilaceae bacterium]
MNRRFVRRLATRRPVRRLAAERPVRRLIAQGALRRLVARGAIGRVATRHSRGLRALSVRARRRLLALAAVCLALAGVFQFWFRDSELVDVDHVTVSGLSTREAPRLRAALAATARSMTTLHLDRERLERAVEAYPVVRALELSPDFPHGLHIQVIEHHPAAMAVTDEARVPVARDGTLLRGVPVEGRTPTVTVERALRGERLEDPAALRALRVAGGAPAAIRRRIESVERRKSDGLVVPLRDGPEVIFGDAVRVRAKWIAAARVLADKAAAGASYIDVRLPGRPAAGGLPAETVTPVAPAGSPTYSTPDGGAAADPGAPGTGSPPPSTTTASPDAAAAPLTEPAEPAPVPGTAPGTVTPGQAPAAPTTGGTAADGAASPLP